MSFQGLGTTFERQQTGNVQIGLGYFGLICSMDARATTLIGGVKVLAAYLERSSSGGSDGVVRGPLDDSLLSGAISLGGSTTPVACAAASDTDDVEGDGSRDATPAATSWH